MPDLTDLPPELIAAAKKAGIDTDDPKAMARFMKAAQGVASRWQKMQADLAKKGITVSIKPVRDKE